MKTFAQWTVEQVQDQFDEMLDRSQSEGPQFVTREGLEVAVLVSIGDWERVRHLTVPTVKELLLADEPRTDDLVSRVGRPEGAADRMRDLMRSQAGVSGEAVTGDQLSEWRDQGRK